MEDGRWEKEDGRRKMGVRNLYHAVDPGNDYIKQWPETIFDFHFK
jgi:hypothetical protein